MKKSQFDPTHRFERLPDLVSSRTCVIRFKGYDTVTGIEVTWHEIDIRSLTSDQKAHLLECAETLKGIKCDTLLSLIHCWMGEDERIFYFITESLSSTSVLEQIQSHVTKRAIARWFFSVLQALSYLHGRNPPIAHGRVCLSSVFVKATTGNVKLIPPLIDPFYLNIYDNSLKLRWYTPPESLNNEFVPAADLWMFGLTLLEALTLEHPYKECRTPVEMMARLENFEPPESLKKVDDPLAVDLIRQCLRPTSKRPTSRELMGHPFFRQDFNEERKLAHSPENRGLEVIFSGKPTNSHDELPRVPQDVGGVQKSFSAMSISAARAGK